MIVAYSVHSERVRLIGAITLKRILDLYTIVAVDSWLMALSKGKWLHYIVVTGLCINCWINLLP